MLQTNAVDPGSHIFYDAVVLLGTKNINQTKREVRIVGYKVDGTSLGWQLTALDNLTFFPRLKRHLKVYHLIARSPIGCSCRLLLG